MFEEIIMKKYEFYGKLNDIVNWSFNLGFSSCEKSIEVFTQKV